MNLIETAALGLLTSAWLLQSAAAVLKTRRAHQLFTDHQRRIDSRVEVREKQRVALIIAVKGIPENFESFLDFALGQDYPDYRVIFVTESSNEPAHAAIQTRLRSPGFVKTRLIVAGKAINAGQKVHNLLAAMKQLERADGIIAFADADLSGKINWLSCLTLPLNLGQADFATGYRWFIPADNCMPNRIIALVGTGIEPWIGPAWRMCLWGGSMAMTRTVFDELEIQANLEGCINDDVRISQLAHQAGKRMRYVRSVAAASPVDFTWNSLFEFGRRQYFQLRIYQPSLWWMALASQLLYLSGFLTSLIRLCLGNLLMLVPLAAVAFLTSARLRARRSYLAARFNGGEADALDDAVCGSAWLDPVMNFVHFLIILSSAIGSEILWAGIRYRVNGPQETEILTQ